MRLPWIATCFLLGFIIVLDPTHTPAQYGRKGDGGDFGGKRGEFGGKRGEFGGKREFNGKRNFAHTHQVELQAWPTPPAAHSRPL